MYFKARLLLVSCVLTQCFCFAFPGDGCSNDTVVLSSLHVYCEKSSII